jgi:hypothetical protein
VLGNEHEYFVKVRHHNGISFVKNIQHQWYKTKRNRSNGGIIPTEEDRCKSSRLQLAVKQTMKAHRGNRGISMLSLPSTLNGGGWSTPRSGRFTPWKDYLFPIEQEPEWARWTVWTSQKNRSIRRNSCPSVTFTTTNPILTCLLEETTATNRLNHDTNFLQLFLNFVLQNYTPDKTESQKTSERFQPCLTWRLSDYELLSLVVNGIVQLR